MAIPLFILLVTACFLDRTRSFVIPETTSKQSDKFSRWEIYANPPVSVVSVCTAELCCCQEEGGSALEILDNLNARSLPYSVEEAPCLGACGGGAMVAIDFEDGSAALVSGLAETLSELGLSGTTTEEPAQTVVATTVESTSADVQDDEIVNNMVASAPRVVVPTYNDDGVQVLAEEGKSSMAAVATLERPTQQAVPAPEPVSVKVPSPSTKQYKMTSDDVRERMRSEASKDSEQTNPWLNMASYLAGKARDKILGSEE